MSEYIEIAKIQGCFQNEDAAKRWADQMRDDAYDVTEPFENPFAYSDDHAWEATATRNVIIQTASLA